MESGPDTGFGLWCCLLLSIALEHHTCFFAPFHLITLFGILFAITFQY